MKIKSILMVVLLVLFVLPTTIAQEEIGSVTVCKEKIDGVGCVVPPRCIEVYNEETQERIVKCPPYYQPRIDVVFVIDSTGSMADEIRTVKTHLIKIIMEVEGGQPKPYLRVGVIAYRDHELEEREYLYRRFELTPNIEEAVTFIRGIEARGGGDLPEAVADGLDIAINDMNWDDMIEQNQETYPRAYAKKLIFLIGDAAPHGEGSTDNSYIQGCPDGHDYRQNIEDAQERGIRIYTISGSGIDPVGIGIFKEIAEKTGGSYTHLSYTRRDVQEYYGEEGFTPAEVKVYAEEAKEDADYDKATNSILTNTLGSFAKESMKAEAIEIGVAYDEHSDDKKDDLLDVDDITEEVIVENEENLGKRLYQFFRKIFEKILS